MREEFEVRLIDKSVVDDAVSIVRSSFNPNYLFTSIYRGNGVNCYIANELDNQFSQYRFFGIFSKDILVGYAEFKLFESDNTCFLNIIAIQIDYKNLGLGSFLLEKTQGYFRSLGYNYMELDVYDSNLNAVNWYNSVGFKTKETSSRFRLKLNKEQSLFEFSILNYPQYLVINKSYGFSFLNMSFNGEYFSLGVIDNDLFIRNLNISGLDALVSKIKLEMGFGNIFYLGKECPYGIIEERVNISRMILKII